MQALLLIAAIVVGLIMIPFGLPGTLVIFAGALCYYLLVPHGAIGFLSVRRQDDKIVGVAHHRYPKVAMRRSTGCR